MAALGAGISSREPHTHMDPQRAGRFNLNRDFETKADRAVTETWNDFDDLMKKYCALYDCLDEDGRAELQEQIDAAEARHALAIKQRDCLHAEANIYGHAHIAGGEVYDEAWVCQECGLKV